MVYAQFFHPSTGYVPRSIPPRFDPAYVTPIEVCGDRGVIIIDARLSSKTIGEIAARECQKRGFTHWRLYRGDSFSRSKPISCLWLCESVNKVDDSKSAYRGA